LPLYVLIQLTPSDSGKAAELAWKFQDAGAGLIPTAPHANWLWVALDRVAGDMLLAVPIGALAVLTGLRGGERRRTGPAFVLGAAVILGVELASRLVGLGQTTVGEVLASFAGVMIGVLVATGQGPVTSGLGWGRLPNSRSVTAVATLILVVAAQRSYGFGLTSALPTFGLYYWYAAYAVNPLEAIHFSAVTFLLGSALGIVVRAARPLAALRPLRRVEALISVGLAATALMIIEYGRAVLLVGIGDLTALIVGTVGGIVGVAAATALISSASRASAALRVASHGYHVPVG
jgi:glycopeptide antibiotics resistance protein